MDDERIERALRAGPPDEPEYRPVLAGRAVLAAGRRRRIGFGPVLRFAGVIAAAVVVVAAVALLRAGPAPVPEVGGDLLGDLRALGRIRIAVTNGSPQIEIPNVGVEGFDVDVAREIGRRLGLELEIAIVDPLQIASGDWQGRWDLAVDSAVATGRRRGVLLLGTGYYAQASVVLVAEGSNIRRIADLDGKRLCVLAGSLAARWVAGDLDLIGGRAERPPGGAVAVTDSTDGCLAGVGAGVLDAFIGDWDYVLGASPAGLVALADSPFVGVAAPAVDPERPGSERLLEEIDRLLTEMRADGTLRDLSLRRFGRDLAQLPAG
jgi:polar amino acid transport system substrate-binding protein